MALETPLMKAEEHVTTYVIESPLMKVEEHNNNTYVELSCGTENVSPYTATSGYPDHVTYYQPDYDWHQHQHVQYQHHDPNQTHLQPHPLPPHSIQNVQLTDLSSRHYYTSPYPEPHEVQSSISPTYTGFTHHHSIPQSEFYNSPLWSTTQPSEYIATSPLVSQPRLFSGIDMSQQVVTSCGLPTQIQQQQQLPANPKPKRKRVQSHSQRKAANVRERRRMFHLNEAFDLLRKRLPAFSYEKRLSRIETLRLAMTYISFMKDVTVGGDPKSVKLKPHGLDLGRPSMGPDMVVQDGSSPSNMTDAENHEVFNSFLLNDCHSDSNSNDSIGIQNVSH